ncbi:MAG: hypothetical protein QG622_2164 [Actinomycetota bacterium]|nr:hypothetical protein [Actinomycetota bacterium]
MTPGHRWPPALPPEALGAVVHGPVIIARSPGVVVGLRCVFAYPEGLRLPVVVVATGVHAEAAQRQRGYWGSPDGDLGEPPGSSWLLLDVQVNGKEGEVEPFAEADSTGEDRHVQESEYWIGELPDDGTLRLGAAWPQVGLAPSAVTLALPGLREAAATAIPLP